MDDRDRFLRRIMPDELLALGGFAQLREVHWDRKGNIPAKKHHFSSRDEIARFRQRDGFHVFVSPTTRTGKYAKNDIDTVLHTVVLWADVDDKGADNNSNTLTDAVVTCNERGLTPSFLIQSGKDPERGHLYWCLERPFAVNEESEFFGRILLAIGELVGGDPSVAGPQKLMRLPGTRNVKPEYGPCFPTCRFIDPSYDDLVYPIDDIAKILSVQRSIITAPTKRAPARQTDRAPSPSSSPSPAAAIPIASRFDGCSFLTYAREHAPDLSEPLWQAMLQILSPLGDEGRALAHAWSRSHPGYTAEATDKKVDYARDKAYQPPSCAKIWELGFVCSKMDAGTGRCTVFHVTSPGRIGMPPAGTSGVGYSDGDETFLNTEKGPLWIAGFRTEFTQQIDTAFGREIHGLHHVQGKPPRPFRWKADVFADARSLGRQLASDLGIDFRADRRHLLSALDVWRAASKVKETRVTPSFGMQGDGASFLDAHVPIPEGSPVFLPPAGSAATRLGLAVIERHEVIEVLRDVLRCWIDLVASPPFVAAMLGITGWALVAPIMERMRAEVRALLVWLGGRTGIGKTTHARVAQCFFGDFSGGASLLNVQSTALALEEAAYWFHGALVVVDDVKRGCMGPDELRRFYAFIQRAWDRSVRRRLHADGTPQEALPFRATGLFTGEDLVLAGASNIARVFLLPVPDPVSAPASVATINRLLPRLSGVTRHLVAALVGDASWHQPAADTWDHVRGSVIGPLGGDPNRQRIAASMASIRVGYRIWTRWMEGAGVEPPCTGDELGRWLAIPAAGQMAEVRDLTPGEWFLESVRTLLASGKAVLEHGSDRCVGVRNAAGVAYILPDTTLALIRQHLAPREAIIPEQNSIAEDLDRMGALAEKDKERRTKRKRIGPSLAITWALREELIIGGQDGAEE